MFVAGEEKFGYLTRENNQLAYTNPTSNKWQAENALVKGRIIQSMSPRVMGNFVRLLTTKEMWDAVAKTYKDYPNSS